MEENYIGYLLNALDLDARQALDEHLQTNPDARNQLELLRKSIAPLALDRDLEPPAGLWTRTLARVAEHRSHDLPAAPSSIPFGPSLTARNWWRRSDVLVAACLMLCALALLPGGISYLRFQHDIVACKNNLRIVHTALNDYGERHNGDFPNVEMAVPPPRNVAGIFIPILNQEGFLNNEAHASCPAKPPEARPQISLEEIRQMDLEEFRSRIRTLSNCYAYSLGYRDAEGNHHGPRHDPNEPNDLLPIMADRPPFIQWPCSNLFDNSPNHASTGQNVLYLDGHVAFFTSRNVGVGGDDIFLSLKNKVEAGLNQWDTVLGASGARPLPYEKPR